MHLYTTKTGEQMNIDDINKILLNGAKGSAEESAATNILDMIDEGSLDKEDHKRIEYLYLAGIEFHNNSK